MEEGYALLNQLRGFKSTPQYSPKKIFAVFGEKAEILRYAQDDWAGCHPELSLRGVSSLNRGGELTLLELHPKRLYIFEERAEIPHERRSGRHFVSVRKGAKPSF